MSTEQSNLNSLPDVIDIPPLVDEVLRHTRPLLSEDEHTIKINTVGLKDARLVLDAQIEALTEQLRRTQDRRKQVQISLEKTTSVYSPIHRLPNELLLLIFRTCLPNFYKDSCLKTRDVRFRLAGVCGWWKDVVTNNPTLWSTLVIRIEDYRMIEVDALRDFLRFSGDQPLKIVLMNKLYSLNSFVLGMLDMLIPHSHRWRYVSINDETSAHHLLAKLTPKDLPMLEELYLSERDRTGWRMESFMESIARMPSLKRTEVCSDLSFPSSVTHISVTVPNTVQGDYVKKIFELPNLLECHMFFRGSVPTMEIAPGDTPLEHATLQTLVTDHSVLLDILTLPSLETLTLCATNVLIPPPSLGSVVDLLKRSTSPLASLSIAQQPLNDSPALITELFPLVSETLKTLYIDTEYSVVPAKTISNIMDTIQRSTTSAGLLPHLTSFGVRVGISGFRQFLSQLIEMLRSRIDKELALKWNAECLQDMGLDFHFRDVTTEPVDVLGILFDTRFKDLQDNGLKIWTKNESRYGSRTSEFPPWVQYAKRKDLSEVVSGRCRCESCDIPRNGVGAHALDFSESGSVISSATSSPNTNSPPLSEWGGSFVPYPNQGGSPQLLPPGAANSMPSHGPYFAPSGHHIRYLSASTDTSLPAGQHHAIWQPDNNSPFFPPSPSSSSDDDDMISPPPGPPVIPDFVDDSDDDEEDNLPTFPRTFDSLNIADVPAVPQSPSQFPFPFNIPVQTSTYGRSYIASLPSPFHRPLPAPYGNVMVITAPPSPEMLPSPPLTRRRTGTCQSHHSSTGTDGSSILLQSEGSSSSLRHTPETVFFPDLERPLSPLLFDESEDLDLDTKGASSDSLPYPDSGYGSLDVQSPQQQ